MTNDTYVINDPDAYAYTINIGEDKIFIKATLVLNIETIETKELSIETMLESISGQKVESTTTKITPLSRAKMNRLASLLSTLEEITRVNLASSMPIMIRDLELIHGKNKVALRLLRDIASRLLFGSADRASFRMLRDKIDYLHEDRPIRTRLGRKKLN